MKCVILKLRDYVNQISKDSTRDELIVSLIIQHENLHLNQLWGIIHLKDIFLMGRPFKLIEKLAWRLGFILGMKEVFKTLNRLRANSSLWHTPDVWKCMINRLKAWIVSANTSYTRHNLSNNISVNFKAKTAPFSFIYVPWKCFQMNTSRETKVKFS